MPIDPPKKKVTRGDSLALYNNSVRVNQFYSDQVKSGQYAQNVAPLYYSNPNAHSNNDEEIVDWSPDQHYNASNQSWLIPLSAYRQDIDQNRYSQRETASTQLNMNAPMQLFDRRINPTMLSGYSSLNGDMVNVYSYDPISVKPWDLLTPEERKLRVERHGTSGTPMQSPQSQVVKKVTPLSTKVKNPVQGPIPIKREPVPERMTTKIEGSMSDFGEEPFKENTVTYYRHPIGVRQPSNPPIPNYKFQGGFNDPKVAGYSTIRSEANRQVADPELLRKEHQNLRSR